MNYKSSIIRMMEILIRKLVKYDRSGIKMSPNYTSTSSIDYLMMIELTHQEKMTTQDLINLFELDRGIVNTVLNRLYSAGLIEKEKDLSDMRKVYISLTDQGRNVYEQTLKSEQEKMEFALRDLSINEQKAVLKFLSRLNQLTVGKYDSSGEASDFVGNEIR